MCGGSTPDERWPSTSPSAAAIPTRCAPAPGSSIPRALPAISNCTSSRRRAWSRPDGRSRSAPASPATSAIPTRASRAATTMSACHAASAATPRWRAPNSPWRSTACGKSTRRKACRWPARSAASTPIPRRMASPSCRAPSISASTCVPTTRPCSPNSIARWTRSSPASSSAAACASIAGRRRVPRSARSIRRSGRRWSVARPSSTFPCCNSAVRPRMMPPPLPPPACRWA